MSERAWKRYERQAAQALGSERLPNSGRGQPDIIAGAFAVEHKVRATLPRWLMDALAQATRNAPAGATPVVVLTVPQGRGRKPLRLAVMDFGHFATWHGGGT